MQLTKSQQIEAARKNDARLRKGMGDQELDEYRRFYGQRRAQQISGMPTAPSMPEMPVPNELTQRRLRLMEQRINSDGSSSYGQLQEWNRNPPAKIPAEPGQSGSSGVYRKGYVHYADGQPADIQRGDHSYEQVTHEEIETAKRFAEDMDKAKSRIEQETQGKVVRLEIGKQSLNLQDLREEMRKRNCRVRPSNDSNFVVAECEGGKIE